MSAPHVLRVTYDEAFSVAVDCPNAHLGAARPCAVWANDDGTERENACTFQQYTDAIDLEDWLHGPIRFEPVAIVEGGTGFEWHAVPAGAS